MSMIPGLSMASLAIKKTVRKAAEPVVTPLIMLVSGTFFLPFYVCKDKNMILNNILTLLFREYTIFYLILFCGHI